MGVLYNNFTGGEVSRLLDGRTDLPGYYESCRLLEGFVPLVQGGATRCPGTKYIAATKSNGAARLTRFVFAKTKAYVLEFGAAYMRLCRDGAQVEDAGSPYEVTTSYGSGDLFELAFVPSWDQMHIFHADYEPRVLTRVTDTNWTLAACDFTYGPFLTENTTTTTITPSATTGTITLTASASLFDADHPGALWELTHWVSEQIIAGTATGTGMTSAITVKGTWDLHVSGTWIGTMKLQKSFDGSAWYDVRVITHSESSDAAEVDQGEELSDGVQYRLNMTEYTSGTCVYIFRARSHWHNGIVEIASVTNSTTATATVINELGGTGATDVWAEGAWSDYRGWPSVGALYEQRLWAGSTTYQPQTVWAGRTYHRAGDYLTMAAGTNDDDALVYTINSNEMNAMRWMAPSDFLLIGTEGDTWKVSATNVRDPITPTNIAIRPQNAEGAAALPAIKVANRLLYVGRGTKRVYELALQETDSYEAEDLTQHADHITSSGIVDWAYQAQPYPILWAVTSDGYLISMTYDRKRNVVGWQRRVTNGYFESVAVIPGDPEDEVWLIVRRTIGGSTVRYIEQMQPFDWGTSQRDCWFVDAGVKWDGGAAVTVSAMGVDPSTNRVNVHANSHGFSDGWYIRFADVGGMTQVNAQVYLVADSATNTFVLKKTDGTYVDGSGFTPYSSGGSVERVTNTVTTLSHLEGQTVAVLGDGRQLASETVSSGTITVDEYCNTIIAGESYTSKLEPMWPEAKYGAYAATTIQGKPQKVSQVRLRCYKSLGGGIGTNSDDLTPIEYHPVGDTLTKPVAVGTGDTTEIIHPGGWQENGTIHIETSDPLPLTVCAILYDLEASF